MNLKEADTVSQFIELFFKSRVDETERNGSTEETEAPKLQQETRIKRKEQPVECETSELLAASMDEDIVSCYLGKFTIFLAKLRSPDTERRVRELDNRHVSNITKGLLDHTKMSVLMASPLVGLVDPKMCQSKENFDIEKLKDYEVEVLDGNHNLHAQQAALHLSNEPSLRQREVILYAGLTDEQCKRVGIVRNKDAANCLPMSDYDFILLVRREIKKNFKAGQVPGKDAKSRDFWKRVYTMLGLKFEKKIRDAKRPIETLAKLSDEEFSVVTQIFEERPKTRASALTKDLQGVTDKADKIQLLEKFRVSKAAFQEASMRAKGNDVHIEVKDGIFIITQGKRRMETTQIKFSSYEKDKYLSPVDARRLLWDGVDGHVEDRTGGHLDTGVSHSSDQQKDVRSSTTNLSRSERKRSKESVCENSVAKKTRLTDIQKNNETKSHREPLRTVEQEGNIEAESPTNSGYFEDLSTLPADKIAPKLKEDALVLCKPFKAKDYIKEDPFIYRVIRAAQKQKFRGELMFGKLETKYVKGTEV